MPVIYDLWDLDSGNRLSTYRTEAEALAAVRRLADAYPDVYADALSLSVHEDQGQSHLVAQGAELVRRAHDLQRATGTNAR